MGFADDVRRFKSKTGEAEGRIVRAVTLSLFSGIIRDTPVDTGRARGNWQTTVGQPASGEIDRLGASAAIAEAEAKTPPGAGQETYLANDLPYIEELEKGSSKQSPEGMVRRNIDRIERNLKKAIRDNKV